MSDGKVFFTGGAVPLDSPTYISRHTDELAFQAVRDNEYLTVIAPRQMGKTSLLYRLQDAVEREYGYATVYLDLARFYAEDIKWSMWAQQASSEIKKQLRVFCNRDLYAEAPEYPAKLAEFFSSLFPQVGAPKILILVDEAATVAPDIRDQFYSQIRTMYNQRVKGGDPWLDRYNFVFAGVFRPERLIENRDNSPFNVSEIIPLLDFSLQEVRQLLESLTRIQPVEIVEDLVQAVYAWTGGHPYLTQRLASLLGARLKSGDGETPDANLVELLIPDLMDAARDNIDHVVKRATASVGMWTRRILNGEVVEFNRNNRELVELELSGAIKVYKEGWAARCRIRNRIYEIAFKPVVNSLPSSESDMLSVEEEIDSLQRQLTQLKRNVLKIQEQKTEFIDPRGIPPDLKGSEEYTLQEIARVKSRLAELGVG